MDTMKILHVFPSAFLGGSELCAIESIESLQKMGVENHVILPTNGEVAKRLENLSVSFEIIQNSWWMSSKPWKTFLKVIMLKGFYSSAKSIHKYIKTHSIDVVITHSIVIPSAAIAARLSNVPHVWYLHEYGDLDHQLKFEYGKQFSFKIINKLSRKIIVNSEGLKKYFSEKLSPNKINRLYYAVKYPEFSALMQKPANELALCMVGRIAKGKNQLVALKALNLLKQESIYPRLVFVGGADQEYLNMLQQYIQINNLENQIVFAGQTDQPWDYVIKSHAVLVCSVMEAFGRVTIEAMKAGRMPVVSDTGAGLELIQNHENGFLFDPQNENELAEILKHIWAKTDCSKITVSARKYALEHFSLKTHGRELFKIIEDTL
ncbi:glycosyltransferase family 4 protein [Flavobacterium sp.]|uniref:glycosyltransferase family 4 protein n=1 Tax=Flavobacterium sp. TaxID=239 RepID=UPI0025C33AF0|nr:glycosyltransferase family 4 protein [Flavobacterium sp.]